MENKMFRKVITFIFLKIVEIGGAFGIVLGPHFLGKFLQRYNYTALTSNNWLNGFWNIILGLLIIILIGVILFAVYYILSGFINLNWKWASILNETTKERKIREKQEEDKKRKIIKNKTGKKEIKRKYQEEEYGYFIGDKVRIVDPLTDSEKEIANKIQTVENITFFNNVKLKGFDPGINLFRKQIEPVKDKRKESKK